ncbi:MAG: ATP-binding protein [Pseudomonadota bacterium]
MDARDLTFSESDTPQQYRKKLARIALDGMYQFVAVLDTDGVVLDANRSALDGAGLKLAAVEHKPFWLCPWWSGSTDIQQSLQQAVARAARGEFIRYNVEIMGRAAGKETLLVDFSLNPVKDKTDKVVFIVAEGRDLTHPKGHDREEAVSELEATLQENARLLKDTQSRWVAVKEEEHRKDELLAARVHELRNGLAPLVSGMQILRMKPDGEQAAKIQFMMDERLKRLVFLVNNLMEGVDAEDGHHDDSAQGVAKQSSTKQSSNKTNGTKQEDKAAVRKENISLQSILNSAMTASASYIKAGEHVLALDIPDADIWLMADFNRLTQAVSNLLINAAIYTAKGGRIKVSMRQEGDFAHVEVADNGSGIATAMLSKMTELFTRTDFAPEQDNGVGAGLALVNSLVRMQGGSVRVESPGKGKGSTFTLSFPVTAQSVVLATTSTPERVVPVQNFKVLIVDDNIESAQTIGWMIEKLGHSIELAHDGISALEKALEMHPEIILLDIGLPGKNGYEVCRELRKQAAFKDTLIIAQTGWGQKRDKDMAQLAGFDHHLTKPLSLESLAEVIARGLPYQ